MDGVRDDERHPLLFSEDYGLPAPPRDTRRPGAKQRAVWFILLSTLFERVAFYAFTNTLFLTLRSDELFDWNNQHAKSAVYIFEGVSYLSTLIFAVISDWKLGRAKTVIIGFILYTIGFITMTMASSGKTFACHFNGTDHPNPSSINNEKCFPSIIVSLVFVAFGAGATKSNLLILGAEQIQDHQERRQSRYFDKCAIAISVGIAIAITIIPYLLYELPYHQYFILYIIAIGTILFSILSFSLGWRYYLHVPTGETIIIRCIPIILNGFWRWCVFKIRTCIEKRHRNGRKIQGNEMHTLNPSDHTMLEESTSMHDRLSSFLDFASKPNGGRYLPRHIEDVKALRGALLVFALLVPFWLVDNQSGVTFQLQGERMHRPEPDYVVTWMSLGDPITVIIGISILIGFLYKYFDSRRISLALTKRFVAGMIFALLSMCVAGFVEIARQNQCIYDSINSRLSIFAQLPQNILIGASQLFGMVASYEYAYLAAPRSGQSLFMSLHFCSIGMSFLIGTIYFNVFPSTTKDINFECHHDGHLYWSYYTYFFNIAGLQFIFLTIFIIFCVKFDIVRLHRQKLGRQASFR